MKRAQRDIAKSSLLLTNCPAEVTDAILARSVVRSFSRGAAIFAHGDPAHAVFIVLEGWVKLFRMTAGGAEAVMGVFTKGRSFGEAAAFQTDVYPVAAEAVTDCDLVQVPAAHLLDLMHSRPEVCTAILASTFIHLHALVDQVEQLQAHSGSQRVAQFLVSLVPDGCTGACDVTLPYDKVLIAGRIGMKPESLSRAFGRLREHGVTIRQNIAHIQDVTRLSAYGADGPAPRGAPVPAVRP